MLRPLRGIDRAAASVYMGLQPRSHTRLRVYPFCRAITFRMRHPGRRGGLHLAAARERLGQLPRGCSPAIGGAPQAEPRDHFGTAHDYNHRLHRYTRPIDF